MGSETTKYASVTYRLLHLGVFALFYTFFYIYPNVAPPLAPVFLPLSWIDYTVPLVPWTFPVYLSCYVEFVVVILLLNDKPAFNALTRGAFLTLFTCGMFFLFYPTTYPRPPYPEVENVFLRFTMWLIGNADTPNNCFPSMHVAMTGMASLTILRYRGAKQAMPFLVWTLAIYISTLTTKQHYFVDIVGGVGVVGFVSLLEHFWLRSSLGRSGNGSHVRPHTALLAMPEKGVSKPLISQDISNKRHTR